MAKIKNVLPRQILNSKGQPTIETTILLTDGAYGTASCPAGTSTGKYEAKELRDKDPLRFDGLGVQKAISNIQNVIAPAIIGM